MQRPQDRGQHDGCRTKRGQHDPPVQDQAAIGGIGETGQRQRQREHDEVPLAEHPEAETQAERQIPARGRRLAEADEHIPARREESRKGGRVREVVMAVVAKHVDGREAVGGERRQALVADQPPRGQIDEAEEHREQRVADEADRQHAHADQIAGRNQHPGEQRRRAKAIVQQPVLREQRLLGIVQPERRAHPQPHGHMHQQIARNQKCDVARLCPGRLQWSLATRERLCACRLFYGQVPARQSFPSNRASQRAHAAIAANCHRVWSRHLTSVRTSS